MAVDYQGETFTARPFPFQQAASFNATRYSTVPWGQAWLDETFETTAIGAGNTGLIKIDVSLPSDYVALLRNFHLQVVDTANVSWKDAAVGFAFQTPGGPYKTSVTAFPEDEYLWYQLLRDNFSVKDRFATDRHYAIWQFGGAFPSDSAVAHNDAWDPTQMPLWLPPTVDSSFQERSMTVFIANASQSQPVQQMTFRASFDLFTFDQAYSAAVMSSPRVFN